MRNQNPLPELLSPAGSYEAFLAAIHAGADAVYLGGKAYSARAYAENFSEEELSRAVQYAHLLGRRVYVTVNTLTTDREFSERMAYIGRLYQMGVDALIMADLGLIYETRRTYPDFPIHASTQASVHSARGADLLASLGVTRVVLARELSRKNLAETTAKCLPEIEVFLHGALCVSHSGQCLMSAMIGGRSGNQGACAQPCRLPYNGGYPLSLKDLSLCRHIPALIADGVSSLKIEGRMKSPSYVARVTSIYRRLLDEGRSATDAEYAQLAQAFSRNGFTDAYYTGTLFDMQGVRREEDKALSRSKQQALPEAERRFPISAKCVIRGGMPATLSLCYKDCTAEATGEIPATAERAPLTEENVRTRLAKTGGTFFTLAPEEIALELEDGLNLSPAALNALRRKALHALLSALTAPKRAPIAPPPALPPLPKKTNEAFRTALCTTRAQYRAVCAHGTFDRIFLPLSVALDGGEMPNGIVIPPIVTEGESEHVLLQLHEAKKKGARYALVGNLSHLALAKEADLLPQGDFRLNITNQKTLAFYLSLGVEIPLLSPELTLPQLRDLAPGAALVYGRIPLMLTERCFMKEQGGCRTCGEKGHKLTDRRGAHFPILREAPHRCVLLNSVPTYMGDRQNLLTQYGISHLHFLFTIENERETESILSAFAAKLPLSQAVRRIGL